MIMTRAGVQVLRGTGIAEFMALAQPGESSMAGVPGKHYNTTSEQTRVQGHSRVGSPQ